MTISIFAGWKSGVHYTEARFRVREFTGTVDLHIFFNASGAGYAVGAGADVVVQSDALSFVHAHSMASILGTATYQELATVLDTIVTTASIAGGNSQSYTVTANADGTYTIASSGNISLQFTSVHGAAGTVAGQVLGFPLDTSIATSVTGTARSYYTVLPSLAAKSKVKPDYERPGMVTGAIASRGAHYSTAPIQMVKLYDWTQEFESSTDVVLAVGTHVPKVDATTAVPWTWEHFFEHVRGSVPFVLSDSVKGESVHYLRPEGAHFDPPRRQSDWDMWDITLLTYIEGRL